VGAQPPRRSDARFWRKRGGSVPESLSGVSCKLLIYKFKVGAIWSCSRGVVWFLFWEKCDDYSKLRRCPWRWHDKGTVRVIAAPWPGS
jgi:hypothetical protein